MTSQRIRMSTKHNLVKHAREQTLKWINLNLKAWKILYQHCVCPESYPKYVFSEYELDPDYKLGGMTAVTLYLVHLPGGLCSNGLSTMETLWLSYPIGIEEFSTYCTVVWW